MSANFDHREPGTDERAWTASALGRLSELTPPRADAHLLVVAAHPDDETLGAGGLICDAAARGARIHVLVASDGEASHPQSATHTRQRLATLRRTEVVQAVAVLARSATVEFLGLPDGQLSAHLEELSAAIAKCLGSCTHLVTPWRGDRHPDHEACAMAAGRAAMHRPGIEHWQYPIWAWHWADAAAGAGGNRGSGGLPWTSLRRLELTDGAIRTKRSAIGCHLSQHTPLSDAHGDEAILPPRHLAHFTRAFETFVIEQCARSGDAAYFDALYDASDDPWGLGERFYERRKRELLLASLPRPRFRRAFEPGCATGQITAELAVRCDEVLAWDGAASAVRQTRAQVAGESVQVQQRRIPGDWPSGRFDLIVLSEVGYYCADLELLAERTRGSLAPDGVLVACHWNHPAPDHPHSAREVHDAVSCDLQLIATHREDDFRLDVWSVGGESVAFAEGIL
ncbi:MAG: bifunctional PIG-L family deacetylase/class I SAM-dependent methyltransferase [Jatrophihabitantaceae bacterium]